MGLRNNTDDIKAVYLLTYMSIRSCYESYLDRLGYSITTFNDGNYTVGQWSGEDGEEGPPYVLLPTFYNVWKQDFEHVKVSHTAEDMGTLCFQFMNHHKYAIGMSADSFADNSLFIYTPKDEVPGNVDKEESINEGEEYECNGRNNFRWSLSWAPTHEESQTDRLLDPDAKSDEIAQAYLHVEMTRSQQLLCSELKLMARHEGQSKVSHSECHYVFSKLRPKL